MTYHNNFLTLVYGRIFHTPAAIVSQFSINPFFFQNSNDENSLLKDNYHYAFHFIMQWGFKQNWMWLYFTYRQQFDETIMQFRKSQKDLNIRLEMEYKSAIDEFSQRQAMQNRVSLLSPIFVQLWFEFVLVASKNS